MQYQLHDEFDVRVGNVDGFEYYDSDEHTVMCEFHDKKYSIAVIGYDSDYERTPLHLVLMQKIME